VLARTNARGHHVAYVGDTADVGDTHAHQAGVLAVAFAAGYHDRAQDPGR
jgi:hypothetical protein